VSHDMLQSVPKILLAIAYAEPRDSVRLEAVRLNGISQVKRLLDFPPISPSADQKPRPPVAWMISLESKSMLHGIKALALCRAWPSKVKLSSSFNFFWHSCAFFSASSSAVYRSSTSSSGNTAKFLQSLQPFSTFISLTMLAYSRGWLIRRHRWPGFLVSGGLGIIIAWILHSSSESRRQGGRRAMLVLEDVHEEVRSLSVALLLLF